MSQTPTGKAAASAQSGFDWRAFDAYLFDIDGTLLNSRDMVHYDAFLTAMSRHYGCPVGLEGIPVQGSTDPVILMAALLRAGVEETLARANLRPAMELMCDEVELRVAELRPELCGAVPELLAELREMGKLMGVTSGNIERIGWAKLRVAGIADFFSFGSFSDRNETRTEIFCWGAAEARRRLGEQARVCFVGDTPADVEAARNCGEAVIAVATGVFSMAELESHGPSLCIPACECLCRRAG